MKNFSLITYALSFAESLTGLQILSKLRRNLDVNLAEAKKKDGDRY